MQFTGHKRRRAPSVIIVSLIDVLLVVLIFLMVTSTFKKDAAPALKLALPESRQAKAGTAETKPFIISVATNAPYFFLDDRPVTLDRLQNELLAAVKKDPLFAQLLKRHTAKVDYDTTQAVAAQTVSQLQTALVDPSINFGATLDAAQIASLRTLCWQSARVELLTPRTVMESVKLTRVGPQEILQHRDGISVNAAVPRLAAMVGAFDRSSPPVEGSTAYQQMMSRFEGHSNTAMGFVWLSTATARHAASGTMRSAEVNAGRAYMRLQLKATELGLQVHPMSQAPQEFAEMKPFYDKLHLRLVGKPATEETVQMFCRIGYCAPQQHTPRRALAGFVKT